MKTNTSDSFPFPTRFNRALSVRELPARAVAKALGFTEATVSFWRTGKKTPTADNVAAIARFLGVSADYLLGLSDVETIGAAPSVTASGNAVALAAGRDAINGAGASPAEVAELRKTVATLQQTVADLSAVLAGRTAAKE